ncbi:hypothetical protein [Oleiagrimonas sp. C23AA]|uniref:hypothetical protein n=1 Tax=Oleiagrimonas sp. C23AA TaxID=2719047 RepID=UPI0014249DF7|nr:hypothetical protein [Oleiagrimonas sp. C23AA]NII10248.1 hypothetical protein [Oleiagrimonas sp. C23AA]
MHTQIPAAAALVLGIHVVMDAVAGMIDVLALALALARVTITGPIQLLLNRISPFRSWLAINNFD